MTTYIIWKSVEDRNVADVNEVIGVMTVHEDDWEKVNRVVEALNAGDEEVQRWVEAIGQVRYGYWKQEVSEITEKNVKEFLPQ